MVDYQYAYLIGNLLIAFPIWLFLFIYRKDLQKKMLIISVMGGLAGPISELYYLQDYWQPQIAWGGR